MSLILVMVWSIVVLSVTEEWFDRLRRANDYDSWWWVTIGITRIVLLCGSIPVVYWLRNEGGAQ